MPIKIISVSPTVANGIRNIADTNPIIPINKPPDERFLMGYTIDATRIPMPGDILKMPAQVDCN